MEKLGGEVDTNVGKHVRWTTILYIWVRRVMGWERARREMSAFVCVCAREYFSVIVLAALVYIYIYGDVYNIYLYIIVVAI